MVLGEGGAIVCGLEETSFGVIQKCTHFSEEASLADLFFLFAIEAIVVAIKLARKVSYICAYTMFGQTRSCVPLSFG